MSPHPGSGNLTPSHLAPGHGSLFRRTPHLPPLKLEVTVLQLDHLPSWQTCQSAHAVPWPDNPFRFPQAKTRRPHLLREDSPASPGRSRPFPYSAPGLPRAMGQAFSSVLIWFSPLPLHPWAQHRKGANRCLLTECAEQSRGRKTRGGRGRETHTQKLAVAKAQGSRFWRRLRRASVEMGSRTPMPSIWCLLDAATTGDVCPSDCKGHPRGSCPCAPRKTGASAYLGCTVHSKCGAGSWGAHQYLRVGTR